MLAILSAVFGFLAPFLPELLKWFTRKQDNAHEIAMTKLRLEAASQEHIWRLEEINATADIAEMKALHAPQPSLGVKLLDAADGKYPAWTIVPIFWLFGLLDWLSGMVRPAVTYAAFTFYMTVKFARFRLMESVVSSDTQWYELVARMWDGNDMAVLTLVLSYWFGNRIAQKAFGWDQRR